VPSVPSGPPYTRAVLAPYLPPRTYLPRMGSGGHVDFIDSPGAAAQRRHGTRHRAHLLAARSRSAGAQGDRISAAAAGKISMDGARKSHLGKGSCVPKGPDWRDIAAGRSTAATGNHHHQRSCGSGPSSLSSSAAAHTLWGLNGAPRSSMSASMTFQEAQRRGARSKAGPLRAVQGQEHHLAGSSSTSWGSAAQLQPPKVSPVLSMLAALNLPLKASCAHPTIPALPTFYVHRVKCWPTMQLMGCSRLYYHRLRVAATSQVDYTSPDKSAYGIKYVCLDHSKSPHSMKPPISPHFAVSKGSRGRSGDPYAHTAQVPPRRRRGAGARARARSAEQPAQRIPRNMVRWRGHDIPWDSALLTSVRVRGS
jgi:hypothetical protein